MGEVQSAEEEVMIFFPYHSATLTRLANDDSLQDPRMPMSDVLSQSLKSTLSGLPMIAKAVSVLKVKLADLAGGIELFWSPHYTSPFLINV